MRIWMENLRKALSHIKFALVVQIFFCKIILLVQRKVNFSGMKSKYKTKCLFGLRWWIHRLQCHEYSGTCRDLTSLRWIHISNAMRMSGLLSPRVMKILSRFNSRKKTHRQEQRLKSFSGIYMRKQFTWLFSKNLQKVLNRLNRSSIVAFQNSTHSPYYLTIIMWTAEQR